MKTKKRKRLRWRATEYEAAGGYKIYWWHLIGSWMATHPTDKFYSDQTEHKTKREAIAACERHAGRRK